MKRSIVGVAALLLVLACSAAQAGTVQLIEPAEGAGTTWGFNVAGIPATGGVPLGANGSFPQTGTNETMSTPYFPNRTLAATQTYFAVLYNDAQQTIISDVLQIQTTQGTQTINFTFTSEPESGTLLPPATIDFKVTENGSLQQVATINYTDSTTDSIFIQSDLDVPEPGTITLLGMGIASLAGYGWRRRKAAVA